MKTQFIRAMKALIFICVLLFILELYNILMHSTSAIYSTATLMVFLTTSILLQKKHLSTTSSTIHLLFAALFVVSSIALHTGENGAHVNLLPIGFSLMCVFNMAYLTIKDLYVRSRNKTLHKK
jgi:hypothetical protein